jgi:hypothetical protein
MTFVVPGLKGLKRWSEEKGGLINTTTKYLIRLRLQQQDQTSEFT